MNQANYIFDQNTRVMKQPVGMLIKASFCIATIYLTFISLGNSAIAQDQTLYLDANGQASINPANFSFDCFEDSPITYGDVEDCECEGKMKNFTFTYQGTSGVTVKAYDQNYNLLETNNNVQNGDQITIEGFDFKGRLGPKTYIQLNNGPKYNVHTSCSEQIIGKVYGGVFTVISYTDGEGNSCGVNPPVGQVTYTASQANSTVMTLAPKQSL